MLYVLDIDDTLYMECDYVRSGFQAVGKWLQDNRDIVGFFNLAWSLFERGFKGKLFNFAMEELGVEDPAIVDLLVQIYREHEPDISLLPDAKEFIIKHTAQELAIITDGHSAAQWSKIKALGLESRIGQIIVTGDLGNDYWKPDCRAFIIAQGVRSPEECVYIADNPIKDFLAPKKLGWNSSIRIRRERSLHFELPTPEFCREAPSFYSLSDL